MSRLRAPANLPDLVKSAFAKARAEGELNYYPTQVTILPVNNIPFQLRFSPALANKPKAPPPQDGHKSTKPFDPFADPPAALKVTDLSPEHFLVLNKFAIVPEHFILATKDFKEQAHVLEKSDLEATMACIEAYEDARQKSHESGHDNAKGGGGDGLYAFFNCGDHSGASQPHRHIQLLPVARMKEGLEHADAWSVLADNLDTARPPFSTYAENIRLGMPAEELHEAYLRLYRRACCATALHAGNVGEASGVSAQGETRISYNMAMTKSKLIVCPRLSEGGQILSQDGGVVGKLALNGTVLAGTALVKTESEWTALRRDPGVLLNVLKTIGLLSTDSDSDGQKL